MGVATLVRYTCGQCGHWLKPLVLVQLSFDPLLRFPLIYRAGLREHGYICLINSR